MALGHEKLEVYRLSISYAAWVCEKAKDLPGGTSRRALMLSRLGGRGYQIKEEPAVYGVDPDSDPDSDEIEFTPLPSVPQRRLTARLNAERWVARDHSD